MSHKQPHNERDKSRSRPWHNQPHHRPSTTGRRRRRPPPTNNRDTTGSERSHAEAEGSRSDLSAGRAPARPPVRPTRERRHGCEIAPGSQTPRRQAQEPPARRGCQLAARPRARSEYFTYESSGQLIHEKSPATCKDTQRYAVTHSKRAATSALLLREGRVSRAAERSRTCCLGRAGQRNGWLAPPPAVRRGRTLCGRPWKDWQRPWLGLLALNVGAEPRRRSPTIVAGDG